MTAYEKKNIISNYIDICNCRLKEYETEFLYQFILHYDRFTYLNIEKVTYINDWNADGKYSRIHTERYYFDRVNINISGEWNDVDDDGYTDHGPKPVSMDGRSIINFFIDIHKIKELEYVRDVMAVLMVPYYERIAANSTDWKQKNALRTIATYLAN